MEPKPRGFTPTDLGLNQYPWLARAADGYKRLIGKSYAETTFFRGNGSIKILDRILPEISHKPNVLLVGLGLVADPIICCYEPFKVAAHLEGKGVDYVMTLVDADNDVMEDIKGRTRLFLACRHYYTELRENFEREWREYLTDTKQEGSETFDIEEGLNFCPDFKKDDDWLPYSGYASYLKDGILVAEVSPQFRIKLASGDIRLVQDDIAVADLGVPGQFDYVECTNVLYLMSAEGQQLALANISRSMTNGGRLLVNDRNVSTGTPLFTRLKGWLDGERLKQLGLEVEELRSVENNSQYTLLRKFGII